MDTAVDAPETRERVHLSWRDRMEDKRIDPDILRDAPKLIWYALLTPPGREFVAQKILRRHDLRTFIPVRREYRRKNKFIREKVVRKYVVIPRYIFCGFTRHTPLWFDLFNLPNISGVVGLEGEPTRINSVRMAKFISDTASGLNAPDEQRFMRTHYEFRVGQTVEVIDGPFKDHKVPVVAIRGAKAALLLELFGQEREVELPMSILQAAE